VPNNATKELQIDALVGAGALTFRELLASLSRDELKIVCRSHEFDDSGRERAALAARLMQSRGVLETIPPKPMFTAHEIPTLRAAAGRHSPALRVVRGESDTSGAATASEPTSAGDYVGNGQ
jgi:hypothetical protein